MILCPYHLGMVRPTSERTGAARPYVCPECKVSLPRDFVEKLNIPRATVGLVGFTGHGKTVSITSLFYLLKFLKNEWESYYFLTLDDNTHKILFKDVPLFEQSRLPDSTPVNFPSPALICFCNLPYFGDWFLSFYDTAGEVFEETGRVTDQGRFVAHSDVVLFIISIADSSEDWPDHIQALLDTYIRAVYDHMRVDLRKRQHLIVVFAKGDELISTNPGRILSDELKEYLLDTGSYAYYFDLEGKIEELKRVSKAIKNWLGKKGGKGFISTAEDFFKSSEYTIISSTGAATVGNRLVTELKPEDPKRVLDPFLWIMEKTRPRGVWERIRGVLR